MNKSNLSLIGFLQALGVVVYCALVVGVFWLAERFFVTPPDFFGIILMLVLLVFSAAVSGAIVFGYPAYLALNNRIKDALSVFVYTLLYCLGIIGIVVIILIVMD